MSTTQRRLLITVVAVAIAIALGSWARRQLGITLDVESVRAFAESLGTAGPILFVFVVASRFLLALPSQIVLTAAGLCFGTVVGTIVGGTGLMISGVMLFFVSRYAGRESIEKRLGPRVRRILELASQRSGSVALVIGCGYPLTPLSSVQAAAGLTPMPLPQFVIASFIGCSIRSSIFAYFGDALAEASWSNVILAVSLFVLMAAIPFSTRAGRSWIGEFFAPRQP
ncbi:MAG: VTT domain-containing protein [Myxococcota bacterium]